MPKKNNRNSIKTDRYNSSTPHEERAKIQEEREEGVDEQSWTGVDYDDIYSEGINWLKRYGYKMIPDLGGVHCEHSIYKRARIVGHDNEGYTPEHDLFTWQLIGTEDFLKVKELLMMFIDQHPDAKNCGKFWSVVYSPTTEKRKPIYAFARREISLQRERDYASDEFLDGISLTATTNDEHYLPIYKWLPQEDWFDPRIRELKSKDLFTILPEHEAEMLMLLIGRALVGRNRSKTTEGVEIRHSFRSMGIMVGRSAGLGKSTLMEHIIGAMKECGYRISIFQNISSRFGWGSVISADLAYNDDLTPKSQRGLITSDLTKSIVSGGKVKTEEKGVDSVETNARCVMICNSNDYAKQDFFRMDSGLKSRVKLLATHSDAKLKAICKEADGASEGTFDLRVKEHWEYLAQKLNTSTRVMALWLMRLCANRFIESIKLITEEEVQIKDGFKDAKDKIRDVNILWDYAIKPGENPLVAEIHSITRNLQIQVDKDATKDFIHFWRFSWANSISYSFEPPQWRRLDKEKKELLQRQRRRGEITVKTLSDLLEILSLEYKTLSDQEVLFALKKDYEAHPDEYYHPYHFLANIRFSSDALQKAKMEVEQSFSLMTEESKIFENVFHQFTSVDGFRLIGSLTAITTYWDNSVDLDEKLQETYERIMCNTEIPECFITMLGILSSDVKI